MKKFSTNLSYHCYSQMEEVQPIKKKIKKYSKDINVGVHLLSGSPLLLNPEDVKDISEVHNTRWKRRKNNKGDSEAELDKVKQAAVSADWILSGDALRGWEPNSKGEIINVVLKERTKIKNRTRKKANLKE